MASTGDTPASSAVSLDLPFSAESARLARQHLIGWLQQHPGEPCHDDARLVVSELVGNAVRHARPLADGSLRVEWAADDHTLDIAVSDGGGRTEPVRVDAGVSDLDGRGLAIIETLASRWWVEASRTSTTVHALLPLC